MRILWFLFFFLAASAAHGDDFTEGTGSHFKLSVDGMPTDLIVSISESNGARVGVEYYFSAKQSGLPVEMWQQFILQKPKGSKVKILEGYLYTSEMKNGPEKISQTKLNSIGVTEKENFLFGNAADLESFKVGVDQLNLPAGKVRATHFRQVIEGDTIDYWISDSAKPIGLVQLKSVGKNNYQLALESLVINIKRKIDPEKAVPMTEIGEQLLSGANRLNFIP